MALERTYIMIKPNAVAERHVGDIIARIERTGLSIERMELAALFTRLEAEFGPAAKAKGLVFRTVPTNVAVDADPVMLERALKNLVANAINYSNPKSSRPEVVVAARRLVLQGKRFVRIGVYDCGDGMNKEERGKIFDAFFRGEAGKRRPGSGFGLGLSIVRGIAEALRAELTIDSHPGRGSVFRLGFPEAASPRREVESACAPVRDPARSFTGTIALVEDNPILRNALLPVFESRGATVLAAAAADEEFFAALSEKEGEVAALVTDYNLGEDEMTGLEVAALVEARLGRTIPVVVLTAIAGFAAVIVWASISLAHYNFRRHMIREGKSLDSLAYVAPGFPFVPIAGFVLCVASCVGLAFDPSQRIALYCGIPFMILCYVAYPFIERRLERKKAARKAAAEASALAVATAAEEAAALRQP